MQHRITLLSIVLGAQLLLAGALLLRKDPLTHSAPEKPLLADITTADKIVLTANGTATTNTADSITLVKTAGAWKIPSYFDAPVNSSKLNELLEKLHTLKRGLPIATSKAAAKRFQVSESQFERRLQFSAQDHTLSTLYLGTAAGVRKMHARTDDSDVLYAVELQAHELPTAASSWFDPNALQPVTPLTALTVNNQTETPLQFTRSSNDKAPAAWQATLPPTEQDKKINTEQLNTLIETVTHLRVTSLLGLEAKPEWQQDHPVLQLILAANGNNTTLTLSKADDHTYVLKNSAHPWYGILADTDATALLNACTHATLLSATTPTTTPAAHQ